jgi:hypothetical protein
VVVQSQEWLLHDGTPAPSGGNSIEDIINVPPGERYDVLWQAREPGRWLPHCHINHHVTNDGQGEHGAGGLTLILDVAPQYLHAAAPLNQQTSAMTNPRRTHSGNSSRG